MAHFERIPPGEGPALHLYLHQHELTEETRGSFRGCPRAPGCSFSGRLLTSSLYNRADYSPYFPLYFLSEEEEPNSMAGKKQTIVKDVRSSHDAELVSKTMNEVRLARLVASHGGYYLLDGIIPFSSSSTPSVYFSSKQILIFVDADDGDDAHGSNLQKSHFSELETEEVEAFASSVLSNPNADIIRDSKTTKKRKFGGVEGARKVPKKSKAKIDNGGVEGEEEEPVAEPRVKDSQTLEGFRRKMAESIILKGHLRHLRNHYHIHSDVLMRIPLANETPDLPEDSYTPIFWEFFNYSLRL
ncbi:hypothetical protein LIER_02233 [Lithospermum erythrorhizon]|uniref:Uncharacterized protein n=1 Tax=Lithospermum erythrorhizon TaxID=34254 RepID=A0AAV3NP51_LITER